MVKVALEELGKYEQATSTLRTAMTRWRGKEVSAELEGKPQARQVIGVKATGSQMRKTAGDP